MKLRTLALTCALTATACEVANSKPNHDQESGYNSSAPSENGSASVASAREPVAPMPNAAVGTTATTNGRETSAAPTPDQAKNVDNTKINERDRHNATLTPMDQGNSESETKISAAVRRAILGDHNLSFATKNIKVITVGTKVTLRGPVKSEQEKASIETLAKRTAGVTEIDNQLEVKK